MTSLSGLRANDRVKHLNFRNLDLSPGRVHATTRGSIIPGTDPEQKCGTFGMDWVFPPTNNDYNRRLDLTTAYVSGKDITTTGWCEHVLPMDYNGHDGQTEESGVPILFGISASYESGGSPTLGAATILAKAYLYNTNSSLSINNFFSNSDPDNYPRDTPRNLGAYDFDNTVIAKEWLTSGAANRGAKIYIEWQIRLWETSGKGWLRGSMHGMKFYPTDGFS